MTRLVQIAMASVVVLALTGTAMAQGKFVPPIRGEAELGVMAGKPQVDAKTNMITTIIKVKNLSGTGTIAGLKVEEYWYDKAGNLVSGSKDKLKKVLQPGEIATLTLQTPKDPKMNTVQYQFSHGNGKIKAKAMKTL